ncbi:MAG: M1 family aminopeptidase [Bacteroidota bacterium]
MIWAEYCPLFAQSSPQVSALLHQQDILQYTFQLRLTDADNHIEGQAIIIGINSGAPRNRITLDLINQRADGKGMRVSKVEQAGKTISFKHEGNVLSIKPYRTDSDTFHIHISYAGIPADGLVISRNRFGDRTFFGDNWPNRARHWLPVVDAPLDKAHVRWDITAPSHYQVIANGKQTDRQVLPDGYTRTNYESQHPLPTKLMVIGAAPFKVAELGTNKGVEASGWVYPQNQQNALKDLAPALPIQRWMSEMIGPFPFEKIAHVQSTTRYGGMENAGCIFYAENAFTGLGQMERLIAHEMAHQWFGDAVTETAWSHVWLSEGFATYFAELYREARYGPDSIRAGMKAARNTVLFLGPDEPLVDSTYADPLELLNANSYQKGAWILHMLRNLIGDEAFWPGIRTYYKRFQHQNTSTADFQEVMEKAADRSLENFFRQWVYQPGHPTIEGQWTYDQQSGTVKIFVWQTGKRQFEVPLEVAGVDAEGHTIGKQTIQLTGKRETFTMRLRRAPKALRLDPRVRLLFENHFVEIH